MHSVLKNLPMSIHVFFFWIQIYMATDFKSVCGRRSTVGHLIKTKAGKMFLQQSSKGENSTKREIKQNGILTKPLPSWQPETGEAALLTGGEDDLVYFNSSVLYPGGCSVPSMESDRCGHVTFLTQDTHPRIAICGGVDGWNFRKDCLVLRNSGWLGGELGNLPDERYESASARLDAGVFILGGHETPSSSVFLRAKSNSWEKGPQLPVEMEFGPCAAPISAHSFLIVYERHVYEFDTRVDGPTSRSGWTRWPQLQVARTNWPGCAVVGNKFIVAGGEDKNGNSLKSTEIIDLRTRNITAGGGMEKPRGMFNLLSISGTLYALGGLHHDGKRNFSANDGGSDLEYDTEGGDNHYLANVEEFVEETGTWKPATSLSGKRFDYGGVAVNLDLICG